jgi:hypothetical protein
MKKYTLLLCLLFFTPLAQAGRLAEKAGVELKKAPSMGSKVGNFFKSLARKAANSLPGVSVISDMVGGGDLEEKVDRIEEKQDSSLDELQKLAQEALETKRKVEDMYYYKERSREAALDIAQGLKGSSAKKFLLAILQDAVGFPINPAEYIPSIPYTEKLKKNLDLDLSLEQDLIRKTDYMFRDTRAALIASGLYKKNPQLFEKEYAKAEAYEAQLEKALVAKEQTTTKIYKEESNRLKKEIKVLEKAKTKKGLTVGM